MNRSFWNAELPCRFFSGQAFQSAKNEWLPVLLGKTVHLEFTLFRDRRRSPLDRALDRASGQVSSEIYFELVGDLFDLGNLVDHLVVPVPLHEIGPAHESAVLGGSAEIMPEVEGEEFDAFVEWLREEARR